MVGEIELAEFMNETLLKLTLRPRRLSTLNQYIPFLIMRRLPKNPRLILSDWLAVKKGGAKARRAYLRFAGFPLYLVCCFLLLERTLRRQIDERVEQRIQDRQLKQNIFFLAIPCFLLLRLNQSI
jgi:hypothetical protein